VDSLEILYCRIDIYDVIDVACGHHVPQMVANTKSSPEKTHQIPFPRHPLGTTQECWKEHRRGSARKNGRSAHGK